MHFSSKDVTLLQIKSTMKLLYQQSNYCIFSIEKGFSSTLTESKLSEALSWIGRLSRRWGTVLQTPQFPMVQSVVLGARRRTLPVHLRVKVEDCGVRVGRFVCGHWGIDGCIWFSAVRTLELLFCFSQRSRVKVGWKWPWNTAEVRALVRVHDTVIKGQTRVKPTDVMIWPSKESGGIQMLQSDWGEWGLMVILHHWH